MKSVFVVQHVHELNEDVKFIGVFATQADAEKAVQQLSTQEGFRDHLDGFHISEYEIGKIHWQEGFFTYYYPRLSQ